MGSKAKKQYLEAFPKSSHRHLLTKGQRKLSKNEYEALDDKAKARYDKEFKNSKHTKKERLGRSKNRKDGVKDSRESAKLASKRRGSRRKKEKEQKNVMHDEGAGVINRESVKALAAIKPHHLQSAATNIQIKRPQIHELVDHQFKDKEETLSTGLSVIRSMMSGGSSQPDADSPDDYDDIIEGEFTEVDEPNDEDTGGEDTGSDEGGVDDDRPELPDGTKASDSLLKEFHASKGKFKSRLGDHKPAKDANGKRMYFSNGDTMTVGDKRRMDYEALREHYGRGSKYKKPKGGDTHRSGVGMTVLSAVVKTALIGAGVGLLALGAGPLALIVSQGLAEMWESYGSMLSEASDASDSDTIDEIITQTVIYLKSMGQDDLHDKSQTMFKALGSASSELFDVLRAIAPAYTVGCIVEFRGIVFGGVLRHNNPRTLIAAIENLLTEHDFLANKKATRAAHMPVIEFNLKSGGHVDLLLLPKNNYRVLVVPEGTGNGKGDLDAYHL